MKESFLIHLLIALCGVVCCGAESSETQNPATLDDKSVHNSKHMFGGDKESVFGDASSREVDDKSEKELLNETSSFAPEIWTTHSNFLDLVETEGAIEVRENDDSTLATSGDPEDETSQSTDPTDTTSTTISEIPTTDESTTTTDDETTPDETTTTMDPDKGE